MLHPIADKRSTDSDSPKTAAFLSVLTCCCITLCAKQMQNTIPPKIGAYGKPSLEDMPLHFNISHAEDYVICAISACEIGCDIEKIRSADLRIAERFFCPEEYSHIAHQASDAERDLLFYRYWTLKESFIKATGMGLNLPFNEFCIELGEESLAEICEEIHAVLGEESPDKLGEDIHIRQSFDQRKYSFTEFSSISGYCCAVCTTGDQQNAELFLRCSVLQAA